MKPLFVRSLFAPSLVMPLLSATLLTTVLSGCVIHIDTGESRPTEHFTDQLTLSVDDLKQLNIDVGAGDLQIEGVVGLKNIEVKADIWTYKDSENGDGYTLTLDKQGRTAQLTAEHNSRVSFGANRNTEINLQVRVPAELALDIDDGSGDIRLADLAASVKLEDGSGGIQIDNLNGNLNIDDNSGSIAISNVTGSIDITDGSGSIEIQHVSGSVTIEDGSGDIEVSHVANIVEIDDGSGDIDINEVKKLRIVESGSGDLSVHGVDNWGGQ